MDYGYRMAQQHVLEEDYDEDYEPTEEGEQTRRGPGEKFKKSTRCHGHVW